MRDERIQVIVNSIIIPKHIKRYNERAHEDSKLLPFFLTVNESMAL